MANRDSAEEYVKTICNLGGRQHPIAVNVLSQHLDISPVSAHEMIHKLTEQGLVTYQPYRGVMLTPAGCTLAGSVVQRHRLWERFLHDTLGMPWATVHEEAGRLEHATSPEVAQRLAAYLNYPTDCPHGFPISGDDCACEDDASATTLDDLSARDFARVVRVSENDPAMLSYVDELGLRPQTDLEVLEVAPFEGPLTILVDGKRYVIGKKLASQIVVEMA